MTKNHLVVIGTIPTINERGRDGIRQLLGGLGLSCSFEHIRNFSNKKEPPIVRACEVVRSAIASWLESPRIDLCLHFVVMTNMRLTDLTELRRITIHERYANAVLVAAVGRNLPAQFRMIVDRLVDSEESATEKFWSVGVEAEKEIPPLNIPADPEMVQLARDVSEALADCILPMVRDAPTRDSDLLH